jgi:hypothetical protein
MSRDYFLRQLRYHKKYFSRVQTDKRAYNKIVDKCHFFKKNAQVLGIAAIFYRKKKIFESKQIKVEEEELETDTWCLSALYEYLPKLPSSNASQA